MYARVVRWEADDAETVRNSIEQLRQNVGDGPPEGVPAKGFTMIAEPDSGQGLSIVLFENEDDYRQGDEALNAMNPPSDGMRRVSVEKWEVGVDLRV